MAGTGDAPAGEVTVEFPFAEPVVVCLARVVGWWPIAADLSGDAALLELVEPVALTAAPLAGPPSLHDHRFWVHGFPDGDRVARQARGRLGGASGPAGEWVQVESHDTSGWPVGRGFSGAPVFDRDADAVVGIVALRDAHRSGHVLPVPYLCGLWPPLAARVGWRLDLDPDLKTHWLPRARGSEVESDAGVWYFTGRHAARQAVCDWLAAPDKYALVVTGGPGTGKSALLAHLLVVADPVLSATVPTGGLRPPVGAFDLAVKVTGLTCVDVIERIAFAAGAEATSPQQLLIAVRERHQTRGLLTVVVDAVEEAASVDEARRIAALLRNLAGTRAVRVLAGVRTAPAGSDRARILAAFGHATPCIDLESREFLRNFDVAEYVERRLTAEDAGPAHYGDRSSLEVAKIGRAVARKAGYNFLIAQLTSRWLTHPSTPVLDLSAPAWDHGLPETIGQAMDAYLDACGGSDVAVLRRVLTALAFARGAGLPRDRTWLTIADALHPGFAHTLGELEVVFHSAAHYLIERGHDGNGYPCYRLYHTALDEHLRENCLIRHPQWVIVSALTAAVLVRVQHPGNEGRNWAEASEYALTHLAGHAAQADRLEDLLADVGFLAHAEPGPLLAALANVATDHAQLIAAVYRMSIHLHRDVDPRSRCRILALDAARLGARRLQRDLNAEHNRLTAHAGQPAWQVAFATGNNLSTATLGILTGHGYKVETIAVAELKGRPIALTADQTIVRLWDLAEQREIGRLAGHSAKVIALAVGELDGRPIALTVDQKFDQTALVLQKFDRTALVVDEAIVRLWDLAEQREIGRLAGRIAKVIALAVGELDGRPIALIVDRTTLAVDHAIVRLWDLAEQREIGRLAGHNGEVQAVAVGELDGRPIAVTAESGQDKVLVRLWDLAERRQIGRPLTDSCYASPYKVALADLDGRLVAIVVAGDKVWLWDLVKRRKIDHPLASYVGGVSAIAVNELDGRPVAITSDGLREVQVWDLRTREDIGDPLPSHRKDVIKIGVTELEGRPIAITTDSLTPTMRVWDLAERRELGRLKEDGSVRAIAVAQLNGRPVALTCDGWGRVQLWDLAEQRKIGRLKGIRGVSAITVAELDGRPVAVTCGGNQAPLKMWDLPTQRSIGRPFNFSDIRANAITVTELGGRPIAITADFDPVVKTTKTTRMWELAGPREIFGLNAHPPHSPGLISAIAVTELEDRPITISAYTNDVGYRGVSDRRFEEENKTSAPLRLWDLTEQREIGCLTGHTGIVTAIAVAKLDGRPIAISGGLEDRTVRLWDIETRNCLDRLIMPGRIHCLALGPHGTLVVGFGSDIAAFEIQAPMTINTTPVFLRLRAPNNQRRLAVLKPRWRRRYPTQ